MRTFDERRALATKLICDRDLDLSIKEAYRYLYHWFRYEMALRKKIKYNRIVKKYAEKLNHDVEAFALRIEMKDL